MYTTADCVHAGRPYYFIICITTIVYINNVGTHTLNCRLQGFDGCLVVDDDDCRCSVCCEVSRNDTLASSTNNRDESSSRISESEFVPSVKD